MEMDPIEIGRRLKELRGSRTREEVAGGLSISQSALAMYEQGERIPRDNIKIRIANFYGRTIEDIFFKPKQHEA